VTAVQLKPVPFTDEVWREVRALFPNLPDEARKPMEDRIAMYVHLDRSSAPPAERRDVLMDLHGLAEQLLSGLTKLDGETLMALLQGNGKAESQPLTPSVSPLRHMSQLFTERRAQLAHLSHWLQFAAKNVPRGRPGRDATGFEFLLGQCDLILQHYDAGRISRDDRNDRKAALNRWQRCEENRHEARKKAPKAGARI
jgi:hypothetical protein